MASILSLIAGLVVGLIAGWLLRGRQIARTQSTEAHVPAQSTGSATAAEAAADTEKAPALVGAKSGDTGVPTTAPAPIAEPVAAEPVAVEPVAAEPVSLQTASSVPVAAERVEFEPTAAEPVATEPIASEPVATERATAEPVATEPAKTEVAEPAIAAPVATEPAKTEVAEPAVAAPVAAEPVKTEEAETEMVRAEVARTEVAAAQTIAEPDDLTKIAGIGPKMAMALAASGITTFEQLAATALPDIRAAVTAAGMRLAPTAPTWPEQAKALARRTD